MGTVEFSGGQGAVQVPRGQERDHLVYDYCTYCGVEQVVPQDHDPTGDGCICPDCVVELIRSHLSLPALSPTPRSSR